jgi:hypothetical protein
LDSALIPPVNTSSVDTDQFEVVKSKRKNKKKKQPGSESQVVDAASSSSSVDVLSPTDTNKSEWVKSASSEKTVEIIVDDE